MSRCQWVHVFPYGVLECARNAKCKCKVNFCIFWLDFQLGLLQLKVFSFQGPTLKHFSHGFHRPLHCLNMSFFSTPWKQHYMLSYWGWDKMANILHTTFSNAFSWMKIFEFQIQFDWSLFLRVQLTIIQHGFRWWLGAEQATRHYLNQCWARLVTYQPLGVTRPEWVKIGCCN